MRFKFVEWLEYQLGHFLFNHILALLTALHLLARMVDPLSMR